MVNVSFTGVFGYMMDPFPHDGALGEGLFVIGLPLGFSTISLRGCFTPFGGEVGGDILAEL